MSLIKQSDLISFSPVNYADMPVTVFGSAPVTNLGRSAAQVNPIDLNTVKPTGQDHK